MLAGPEEWNRRRLQVFLAVAAIILAAVVGGLVWSVIEVLQVGPTAGAARADSEQHAQATRAQRPASIEAAQAGPLSTASTGTIRIPQPTSLGEAQVGTGFPRSARGRARPADRDRPPRDRVGLGGHRAGRDPRLGGARRPDARDVVGCHRGPDRCSSPLASRPADRPTWPSSSSR